MTTEELWDERHQRGMGVIDKGLLRHVLTSPELIPDLATQRARHMNRTALPADCYLSPLRIKMGVDKKVLYMDVTQTSTVAQAYRFVEDKEGQRDFKLMYNNSCLEKDDTQLIYLIDDFASDVVVQPVDGLLGGMEKGKQATRIAIPTQALLSKPCGGGIASDVTAFLTS